MLIALTSNEDPDVHAFFFGYMGIASALVFASKTIF